ncbi:hypothetical protein PRIPAC_91521 [Pristionchus pacificus]|uniref:RNA-directed DNA polymerase n=1 Tax=Pristionchus pacificus TaxID=54126 RepID=A0A2A6B472_PRIPA|nr:hypothetical protein PRIPAC_91521 [Pristionchus pacificus]|eukprot:PDM60677.1 hypothetical protein PRIPAC_53946 [Pristionchus pacificus]
MAAHPPTGCSRIQPPVYEKHGSSSFSEFRASLYDYWNFIGSTLVDAKRMLPTVLKGEARIIYQSIPDQMRTDNSSMDRLMETFEQRLFSDTEIDLLKDELRSFKQSGRPVHSFAEDIRRAAEKAYPGNTDDIARTRDREAKEAFLSGLDDTIRVDVRKLAPPNFQVAIKNAQQMENIIRKEKKEEKIDSLIQGVNSLFTNPAQQEIIRVMKEGIDSPLSRKYGRKYSLQDGMLYLKERGRWTNPLKVILPEEDPQLEEIVRSFHTSPHLAAHAGVEKTLQLLADRAYWKGMREIVNNVCRSCPQCAKCKTNPHDNTVE